MADVISLDQVQAWLEQTKLPIARYDADLYRTAHDRVFGAVAEQYDVSSWVDQASTPRLIQDIIAGFVAAYTFRRAYSEVGNDTGYATWLEGEMQSLLDQIADGSIIPPELVGVQEPAAEPLFYPNDMSGQDPSVNDDGIKFTMGAQY